MLKEVFEKPLVKALHNPVSEMMWSGFGELLRRYFRLQVTGVNRVPSRGKVCVIANHSGFAGLDAVVIGHVLKHDRAREPRILAHRAYFDLFGVVKSVAESFGLRRASVTTGAQVLDSEELLLVFPEGEQGNFKPSSDAYRLQKFHTGFARMAVMSQATIVPSIIIGAEESSFNWGNLDLSRFIKHLVIPLPVNLFPLPSRWKIKFLKPIPTSDFTFDDAQDDQKMQALARRIRRNMQQAIMRELAKREFVYLPIG